MYETTTRIESFQDLARILKEAIAIHCVVKQGLSSWFHYIVLGQSWNSHRGNEEVINKSTRTENKETNNRDKFESDIGTGLFSLENDQYPAIEEQFGKAYALFKKKEETEVCSIATNNCEHFVDYILRGYPERHALELPVEISGKYDMKEEQKAILQAERDWVLKLLEMYSEFIEDRTSKNVLVDENVSNIDPITYFKPEEVIVRKADGTTEADMPMWSQGTTNSIVQVSEGRKEKNELFSLPKDCMETNTVRFFECGDLDTTQKSGQMENKLTRFTDCFLHSKEKVVFYKSKRFQRFDYLSCLTRNCSSRVEKIRSMSQNTQLQSSITVQIRYTGNVTQTNLMLVTKKRVLEHDQVLKDTSIWEASPLICFQNNLSLEKALTLLRRGRGHNKILVKSKSSATDPNPSFVKDENIVIVGEEYLQKEISRCLEEPLRCMLTAWKNRLTTMLQTKQSRRVISEIDGIQRQMSNDESCPAHTVQYLSRTNIVPPNVKKYLFSNPDVNSFGIWKSSIFKVFVNRKANKNMLHKTLVQINNTFFDYYRLEIENKKVVETFTMKQGDCISSIEEGTFRSGTLGAFVTKSNESRKKYGLTCGHVFPEENIPAYEGETTNEIGKCVFSTRDMPCDFAAIEINDSVSDNCDTTFRRNDNKKTNAKVYYGNTENLGIVHKNGAVSGVTDGTILSSEFYVKKLIHEEYQDSVFFVRGTEEHFSLRGDSGSLVFSRPTDTEQNYVNVVGMVYGNNVIIDGFDESDEDDNVNNEANGSSDIPSASSRNEEVDVDPEYISSCFRICPALDLFERERGIHVKFKDDLTSSSSTSSDEAS